MPADGGRPSARKDLAAAADHCFGQVGLLPAGELSRRHHAAVAQHRRPVAKVEDLAETMRDIDDRHALATQFPQDGEQTLDLAAAQRGGRLVEHQHGRIMGKRLGDFDELALGKRQQADRDVGGHLHADPGERRPRCGPHRGDVEQADATRLVAQCDILRHRQVWKQAQLLVDGGDA